MAHHQSEEYNLTTALRQTSTGFLLSFLFYIPLFLIGVPAEVYVTVASANLIYQYWVHTEHIPKLGWYEYVFVTPSNHRVHHAQNDVYVDRNYGGVFILWDRLFGTFQEELDEEPCIYGIPRPAAHLQALGQPAHLRRHGAGRLAHGQLARQVPCCGRVRAGARRMWPERFPREKTDLEDFSQIRPADGPMVSAYALLQLLVVMGVGIALLFIPGLSYGVTASVVGLMLFTMVCTGHWLDGRRALNLELSRLVLVGAAAWLGWQLGFGAVLAWSVAAYATVNLLLLPLLLASSESRPRGWRCRNKLRQDQRHQRETRPRQEHRRRGHHPHGTQQHRYDHRRNVVDGEVTPALPAISAGSAIFWK